MKPIRKERGMVTVQMRIHEPIWNQILETAEKKGMEVELFVLCALTIGLEIERDLMCQGKYANVQKQ